LLLLLVLVSVPQSWLIYLQLTMLLVMQLLLQHW